MSVLIGHCRGRDCGSHSPPGQTCCCLGCVCRRETPAQLIWSLICSIIANTETKYGHVDCFMMEGCCHIDNVSFMAIAVYDNTKTTFVVIWSPSPSKSLQCTRCNTTYLTALYDDVIKWKHYRLACPLCGESLNGEFPPQRPMTRSFDVSWINGWVNNRGANDLRRHHAHYVVTLMSLKSTMGCVLLPISPDGQWSTLLVATLCHRQWGVTLSHDSSNSSTETEKSPG